MVTISFPTRLMSRTNVIRVFGYLLLLCLLTHSPFFLPRSYAQAPDTVWTRTVGGADWDFGCSLAQIDSTHFLITGYSHSFGNGYEYYLICIDVNGDTMWTRTYGGINDDVALKAQRTAAGDFAIAGWTSSFGSGLRDAYLILTDAQGDTLWTRTYGGAARDIAYGVCTTMDGGFLLVGETRSSGSGLSDLYLVKVDSQGDSMWAKPFGGSGQDMGYSVLQTSDSGFIAVGFTESSGSGMGDLYILKTDVSGDSIWAKTFGGSLDERAMSIRSAIDSGFVITGYSSSFGAGGADVYALHISDSGDSIWAFIHGGVQDECGYDIRIAPDAGYLIAGRTRSFGSGNEDVYLLQLNDDGDTIWTKTLGGALDDGAACLAVLADHGLLIAGETFSYGSGGYDFWIIRTEPVAGIACPGEVEQHAGAPFHLRAYPNPFTTVTRFEVLGTIKSTIQNLWIYDTSGRRIRSFSLVPGNSELATAVMWDGRDEQGKEVPPGIYFLIFNVHNCPHATKVTKVR